MSGEKTNGHVQAYEVLLDGKSAQAARLFEDLLKKPLPAEWRCAALHFCSMTGQVPDVMNAMTDARRACMQLWLDLPPAERTQKCRAFYGELLEIIEMRSLGPATATAGPSTGGKVCAPMSGWARLRR